MICKGDTLFNYVHPNNDAMIKFLKSKGEKNKTTIKVGNNEFDY